MEFAINGIVSIPASPFDENNALDCDSLRREVDFCIEVGAGAFLGPVLASEVWQLTVEERRRFVEVVADQNRHRIPYIAGVSSVDEEDALALGRSAAQAGADAVSAMLPQIEMNGDWEVTHRFFSRLAEASGLPVVIQTGGRGPNDCIPTDQLMRLIREIPSVRYIKEEGNPANHRITALLNAGEPQLKGVFGGTGGRFLIDEMRRGVCGCAPICNFTDVLVRIWNLFHGGYEEEAMDLHEKLCTMLNIEFQIGLTFGKEILRRRGLIKTNFARAAGAVPLDDFDLVEMDKRLERLAPYFDQRFPLQA